jgi:hypothetical protein
MNGIGSQAPRERVRQGGPYGLTPADRLICRMVPFCIETCSYPSQRFREILALV